MGAGCVVGLGGGGGRGGRGGGQSVAHLFPCFVRLIADAPGRYKVTLVGALKVVPAMTRGADALVRCADFVMNAPLSLRKPQKVGMAACPTPAPLALEHSHTRPCWISLGTRLSSPRVLAAQR